MKNRIAAWLMTAVLAVTTVGADASIVFADNPDVAAESVVEKTEEGSLDSGEVTDSADNENLTDVVNENAESISDSVSQPDSMTATEEGEEVNTPIQKRKNCLKVFRLLLTVIQFNLHQKQQVGKGLLKRALNQLQRRRWKKWRSRNLLYKRRIYLFAVCR